MGWGLVSQIGGFLSSFSFSPESGLEEKLLCIRPVKGGETSHCHFLTLHLDQMLQSF